MKHLLSIWLIGLLTLAFAVDDAEARRLGGGRSLGAQRSIAPSKSVQQTPPSQAAGATAAAPAGATPKPAGNRWLGPIAGLAAGLGLGWLIGQGGFGGMMGSILLMAALALAVMFVVRLFARPKPEAGMQYAGAGEPAAAAPLSPPLGLGSAPMFGTRPQANIPPGFDTEGFVRQAKLNFIRLQAAHDSGKLDDLREFTTDEMLESIRQDVQQRGGGAQQTDVVSLEAELLEALTEGDTHWASVRFSGMIRENPDAQPESFAEVWNLAKPVSGATGWVLAGIQQLQ